MWIWSFSGILGFLFFFRQSLGALELAGSFDLSLGCLIYRDWVWFCSTHLQSLGSALHSKIGAFLLASASINHSGVSMSSRRHDLLLQFEGLAVASSILHFYSFIGFNFLISIWFLLFTEEERRFRAYRLGSHAPAPGLAFRLMCAALNWRDHLNRRTRLSGLIRHRDASCSFRFSAFRLILDASI